MNSAYHPFSITADSETNGISIVNVLGDVSAVATCPAPQAVLLAPDEKQMVVACWAGYGVSKSEIVVYRTDFSARPWPIVEQTGAIKVDGALTAGRFHPGGASVLLVDRLNHQLMEFSVRDMKVAKTWPTGELPSDVELVTVTTAQAQKLARTETTGRQMLKKVLAQMQAARKPFADVSWVETRSEAQLSPLTKTASKNAPDGKKTEAAGSIRLQNYLKGPGRLRTEASNGVIRLAANGTMISILPDGRYWVTPRQELLPLVLGLPALSVDDAVRQLAGDVPGSLEMRSGIAVDVVTEIKDGHHGYFVIGAFKGGERVPQLWVDTETGLPTNMADKFPVVAARSGHDQTDFNGTVETKLYDFTQQEGKYVMPARMERVIDGKFTEDVKVDQVKIDSGLNDHQFDLARLGNVARKPKFEALTASKQATPKAIPVAADKEEYIQHPFQEHAPYVGNPPVRGIHLQYIADWGVYTVPIPLELQLHNLKDGGVALQYNCPDGCPDIVAELKKIAAGFDKFMLVAPYPLMDAKIALTAWEKLETLDHVDAARITEFIKSNIGINHHAH